MCENKRVDSDPSLQYGSWVRTGGVFEGFANEGIENTHLVFGQRLTDLGGDEDAKGHDDADRDSPKCGGARLDDDLSECEAGSEGADNKQGEVTQGDTGPDTRVRAEPQVENRFVGVIGAGGDIEVVPGGPEVSLLEGDAEGDVVAEDMPVDPFGVFVEECRESLANGVWCERDDAPLGWSHGEFGHGQQDSKSSRIRHA